MDHTTEKTPHHHHGEGKHTHHTANPQVDGNYFISGDMKVQLQPILDEFNQSVFVKTQVGTNPLGEDLAVFSDELAALSPKIHCEVVENKESASFMDFYEEDGTFTGVRYQTIPGGHGFNSFLIGLYNLSQAGKPLDPVVTQRISALSATDIALYIPLTCPAYPDLVVACQRIAMSNPDIFAIFIDVAHQPEMAKKYQITTETCIVIDGKAVCYGKKLLSELLEIIEMKN